MNTRRFVKPKFRIRLSLFVKLAGAFAIVSVLSIILSLVIFRIRALGEFNHYIRNRVDTEYAPQLANYYTARQGWDGVEAVFLNGDPARPPGPRWGYTIVSAPANDVVFGTGSFVVGQSLNEGELQEAVPIVVNARPVGWLLVEPLRGETARSSPEAEFANQLTNTLALSFLISIGFALVAGIFSARALARPIHDLTAATRRVAQGELGVQVRATGRDELGQLAEAFNHMSADLAKATGLRRQMTADIAHELRTPLSVILGYAEALHDGKLTGSPEVFESLHVEARQLQRLVEDLRVLSLADAGELPLATEPIAPEALLERARLAFASQAARLDIALIIDVMPGLPPILIDPDRISQALGNLINNAFRYTPGGGKVSLLARLAGDNVEISVRDNGKGIDAEDLPHIFDRFYRVDQTRYAETGESGLGLAITKSIVEAHGGTIHAKSALTVGTTLILSLPVASSP